MHRSIGFSLIELMVVIAIISILAVVAVPCYQDYTLRAHFAEVIAATGPYKTAISLALQEGAALEGITTGAFGIPAPPMPTKNLASLTVEHGTITATATSLGGNATFILVPNANGTDWTIDGTCLTLGLCHFV